MNEHSLSDLWRELLMNFTHDSRTNQWHISLTWRQQIKYLFNQGTLSGDDCNYLEMTIAGLTWSKHGWFYTESVHFQNLPINPEMKCVVLIPQKKDKTFEEEKQKEGDRKSSPVFP